MREIKFRAWIPDAGAEGIMLYYEGESYFDYHCELVFEPNTHNVKGWDLSKSFLMQYTGLKDKNGKEIYEGDVVKCDDQYNGIVEYRGVGFVISLWYLNEFKGLTDRWSEYGEVIGNIYENPELIKKN